MTQAVARILGEVERLSEPERRELRRALVEGVPMSEDLTEEDFAAPFLSEGAFLVQGIQAVPPKNRAPNKAGAGNGARALLFHVERLGRAVPDLVGDAARKSRP